MRILQIHLSINQGGAFSAIKNISSGMSKIGHYSQEIFKNPIDYLSNFNYDGVLLHSFQGRYTQDYLDTLYFLEKYNIPYIVLLHDYWPICPQTNLSRHNEGLKECKITSFDKCDPFKCGLYQDDAAYNYYINSLDYVDPQKRIEIYDIIKEKKTVCFNSYSINIFKENGFNNIRCIHHGVDLDLFKPINSNKKDFTLLFTNAWGEKELKGFKHWLWVKKNIQGVQFKELLGNKLLNNMPSFYNDGHCLLFLSLWPETFGLVMLEALACNIPVISYPIGVATEIIKDDLNGYLINNVQEIQDRIEKIKVQEYNCRDSILHLDIKNICKKYIDFLGE